MPEDIDAVILAGGINRKPLYPGNRPGSKALVEICGRPMLSYTIVAAREARGVRGLTVVGPPEVCSMLRDEPDCRTVVAEESLLTNLRHGIEAAQTRRVLFLTADVPLIRAVMIEEFVTRAAGAGADLCGSVVERRSLGRYSGTRKAFIRLADGDFQHGNLFVIDRSSLERPEVWRPLDRLYRARKNGLATAACLGPRLLYWFAVEVLLLHKPTLREAAARISRVVRAKIEPVESSYPEIMLDVDEPWDYAFVERFLRAEPIETSRLLSR
jgi:CTP:molybdopterin cytidylyltransferase MocA